MKRPKIYATGNEHINGDFNISYYIVEKDEKFLDWLRQLIVHVLGMNEEKFSVKFIKKTIYDENEMPLNEMIYEKDIMKMIDLHEHYEEKGNRVDVFYGSQRVFLTFRKSRETRDKFVEFIEKTRDWINVEKVEELPAYVGKQFTHKM